MAVSPSDNLEVSKTREVQAHRMNLYLPESVYATLQAIVEERGYRSPTEVVQQGLRMALLAYKQEANPEEGLFWKQGDNYSKVKLI